MAQVNHPIPSPLVEARAQVAGGKGVRVFLRRVSPRGAMVQGADLPERSPRGVMVISAAGAGRMKLPRWRFAPRIAG